MLKIYAYNHSFLQNLARFCSFLVDAVFESAGEPEYVDAEANTMYLFTKYV